MKKLLLSLAIMAIPLFASADMPKFAGTWQLPAGQFQEWIASTGESIWIKVIGPIKVHAGELTLEEQIKQTIKTWADWYDVSRDELIKLAQCESSLEPDAFNPKDPHGGARGLFQYLKPTFDYFKKRAGLPDLKYESWQDQARLTAWAWSKGHQKHWLNCWSFQKYGTWNKEEWI